MSVTTDDHLLLSNDRRDSESLSNDVIESDVLTPAQKPVWSVGHHCPELDGVRGIAILMVTLYRFVKELDPSAHPGLRLAKGYCEIGERGVDLFFVLSGFLITGILLQTKDSPGYFKNFMVRRALRIFPLYFTALLVCLFLLPSILGTRVFDLPSSQQLYLWSYTSNVRMAWENAWCFGPLDHFWSLAVEEHFYLIWPAVVFFLSPKALLRVTVATAVTVGLVRTVFALWPQYALAVDVLTLFRCDALCLGALLAVVMAGSVSVRNIDWVAKRALPILIAVAMVVVLSGKRWMGIPHTLFSLLWVMVMAVVVTRSQSHILSQCLRWNALQWLGKYSYGMYVVQLPLVTLLPITAIATVFGWQGMHPLASGAAYVAFMIGLTCAIAFTSYHLLEKRFLSLKRFFGHTAQSSGTHR
jgi:peptidoglycan/LPS O-acetylase OafA/YrhL